MNKPDDGVDLKKSPEQAGQGLDTEQPVTIREVRAPKDMTSVTLYEERVQVAVERAGGRQITFQKRVIEEEVQIPVTLRREVLELTTALEGGTVKLNGELLEPGKTYQITLTEERPVVAREIYPVEQVEIRKEWISEVHQQTLMLGREVLDIGGAADLIREQRAGESLPDAPPPFELPGDPKH